MAIQLNRFFITCSLNSLLPFTTPPSIPSSVILLLFPHHFSSSQPQPQPQPPLPPSAISDFLLNECGFSHSEITKVVKTRASLLRTKSAHTARETVQLLRDSGFTERQLNKTIIRNPSILTCRADGQLKVKMEFLKALGLNHQDLANAVSSAPKCLDLSLEKSLRPNVLYLESVFGSKANLAEAIKRTPQFLSCNLEKKLKSMLELLKQYRVEGELLSLLLSRRPQILRCSAEFLKLKMERVKDLGILEGSKTFVNALHAVVSIGDENVERKVKHMASLGLLEEEIHLILKKFPQLLTISMNKMQKTMDFLTHTAQFLPNIVVTYPKFLSYSLERRLKPRHRVFKALSSMQQSQRLPSQSSMFQVGEKKFLEKFMECSPQASMLKEIYNGKSTIKEI